ncbi:unnamed protein product [Bursaphelenchus okinawaensis]|uniref:SCP domain-containing protein n=1 Tax=Bursaphelenchus okinawaensis TaxID=465554 RepID=A0A811LPX3_9BILA|nr:unnamed protein product [Bursaphelenchus okinawaensis]CAG9127719.1 unnamed protein product [Bursaphelenchus okinawaensis]
MKHCIVLLVLLLSAVEVKAARLSSSQKKAIVKAHNDLRRTLATGGSEASDGTMPEAANMNELVWDDDLEAEAQTWAQQCEFRHPDESDYGQNIASQAPAISSSKAANKAMVSWWSEIAYYPAETAYEHISGTGHFTQMAWALTTRIGCAVQTCTEGGPAGFDDWSFTVCNYYPKGNMRRKDIYISGEPCSECEAGCHNSLCAP